MPQLEELKNLAAKDIEPCPPSWPLVRTLKKFLHLYGKELMPGMAYLQQGRRPGYVTGIKIRGQLRNVKFMEFNIAERKNETDIRGAVGWLEEACRADERILEKFISLNNIL